MRVHADESDLPTLQSIQLGHHALQGESGDRRKTITEPPYNYRNTLTMRSEIKWSCERIDIPSLMFFRGSQYNFQNIGSITLKSRYKEVD